TEQRDNTDNMSIGVRGSRSASLLLSKTDSHRSRHGTIAEEKEKEPDTEYDAKDAGAGDDKDTDNNSIDGTNRPGTTATATTTPTTSNTNISAPTLRGRAASLSQPP